MPRRDADRPWREYRLAILVLVVVGAAGLVIFVMGSTAGPFQPDTYPYVIELDDAAGIRVGSIVRVGGVTAGEVAGVEIVAPEPARALAPAGPVDTLPRPEALQLAPDVRVTLSLQEPFIDNITPSSRAELALLGVGAERYVKITPGDVRERPLPPGSTIPSVPSVDWDLVLGRLARALNEAQEVAALTDEIKAKVAARGGSAGRLLDAEAELYPQIRTLQAETKSLLDLIDRGPGFLALYRGDRELQARIDSLSSHIAAIEASATDPEGSLRSWSERTELRAALTDLRADVEELDARLESGQGTLGRFLHDQELWIQVRRLQQEIGEMVATFKADPLGFVNIEIF